MGLNIVILAAGQGSRMYSSIPKVLHKIGGEPLLWHVITAAAKLNPEKIIIVYGHGGDQVRSTIDNLFTKSAIVKDQPQLLWVHQEKQLGTGHALACAIPYLDEQAQTLLLYGDVPLISVDVLALMLKVASSSVAILSASLANPYGYGRIIRDANGDVNAIVEEKDASVLQRAITEVNSGIYLFPNNKLVPWLRRLKNDNSQGEYYITDVIAFASNDKVKIEVIRAECAYQILGVNNKMQLAELERVLQQNRADDLLKQGVTLLDKSRIDIRGTIKVGRDVEIDINCVFEGDVVIGDNVLIGAGSILKDVVVDSGVVIKPYSVIEGAKIGANAQIGPFARIRPDTELSTNVHIGNFVEIKKSVVANGSKINHLTYIGDAIVGSNVNVGAGSITCNYDGKNKFTTRIEDESFIGSGTMMVAPVTVGKKSTIGAGSVITKNTPENELTVSRAKQVTITGWRRDKE